MNGNYEVNRHLAKERIADRMRDAEAHRQAKAAREQRPGLLSRGLHVAGLALLRLGSRLRSRLHITRPALLRRHRVH